MKSLRQIHVDEAKIVGVSERHEKQIHALRAELEDIYKELEEKTQGLTNSVLALAKERSDNLQRERTIVGLKKTIKALITSVSKSEVKRIAIQSGFDMSTGEEK